jgi:hypothetical protein
MPSAADPEIGPVPIQAARSATIESMHDVDELLADEIRSICATARSLAEDELPTVQISSLRWAGNRLLESEREVIDWRLTFSVLTRQPEFWEHLIGLIKPLCQDKLIDELTGWIPGDGPPRAESIWRDVLQGLIERYRETSGGWDDDAELVRRLIAEWRAAYACPTVPMQTLVPLHNLRGPDEPMEIEAGVTLRPITDQERAQFWESFVGSPSSAGLTVQQLAQWSHALDLRWEMEKRTPADYSPVDEKITDVVRAVRLQHPGQVGYSLTWTRTDPPDWPGSGPWVRQRLTAPRSLPSFLPIRSSIGPHSVVEIRRLLEALRETRGEKALAIALRRFDLASGRESNEDTLIDLWIAFEALLLPDGMTELNYRVALRLARLCGDTPEQRRDIFTWAKKSYNARSKIVHGTSPPDEMPRIIPRTQGMAREALRRWLLDRPADGVATLDTDLLA